MTVEILSYLYMAIFLIFYLIIAVVMTSQPHTGLFALASIFWILGVSYQIFFGIFTNLYAFAYLGVAQIIISFGVFTYSLMRRS